MWADLGDRYPPARAYIDAGLYGCREHWAWTWISHLFTAGIRTTGRVEVENRVNRIFGGPKKSLFTLFTSLNERTTGQNVKEMELLRQYIGPFALQRCWEQMAQSVFYKTEVLQRPEGICDWSSFNRFDNDQAYISTKWLIRLVSARGLKIQHLLQVSHLGTKATHVIALLPGGRYVCDCCMGMNLGVPCRHYFQVLTCVRSLTFHIGLIRARFTFLSSYLSRLWCANHDIQVVPRSLSRCDHSAACDPRPYFVSYSVRPTTPSFTLFIAIQSSSAHTKLLQLSPACHTNTRSS
ncbi:hypothetical protein JAAARDRAFT_132454 [Jaapia argillacea MUCL 33604]|uniref:SWIM-type domain-containing protein n=1 Tax=Jaapia argillacea MUCL 33604 TaxID=933084 RepID=A0A067Q0V9_9AGAM|nr:hypothetical protein JAAARDRAFT_132454 [Jaapia argillacea MUCL 33604]